MPVYPLLCLASAYCTVALVRERRAAGWALGALLWVSVCFSIVIGLQTVLADAPVALGRESQSTFLTRAFPGYAAFEYLNDQPAGSGVVLYGEPLGLYCRQPYMWGEPTHGKAIAYEDLATPADLRKYLLKRGYRYILVNSTYAPLTPAPTNGPPRNWDQKVYALIHEIRPVYDSSDPRAPISIYRL
jgi:hypothetical protein